MSAPDYLNIDILEAFWKIITSRAVIRFWLKCFAKNCDFTIVTQKPNSEMKCIRSNIDIRDAALNSEMNEINFSTETKKKNENSFDCFLFVFKILTKNQLIIHYTYKFQIT